MQGQVGYLVNKYFNEDKPEKGINGADPFVIGLALAAGNPPLTVVSGEYPGSKENPKIPWVCKGEGVPHTNFLGLIKAEDWKLQDSLLPWSPGGLSYHQAGHSRAAR